MPKVSPLQSSFNGGEFSPLMYGRVDLDRYKQGMAICQNYIPTIQGGLTRRPGTFFAAEVKDSSKATRLERFEFSTTQAYILEFGDLYVRIYMSNGQVVETGNSITGITAATPPTLTYSGADPAGLANGQEVYISGVGGMTEVNGKNFKIGSVNTGANTYTLLNMDGTNVVGAGYTAYTSGGTAERVYTVTTTYAEADLFQLKFTQSADTLYITHPSYATRKLTRTGHTTWTLSTITFLDGPYLPLNATSTTIAAGATTGATTLTASASLWASTDVGRLVRLKHSSTWGYATITGYTSPTVVNATVTNAFGATTATAFWRLGLWSDTTGYAGASCFHEDRLCFIGSTGAPQRIDASKSADYENFAPTDTAGVVADDNALAFNLNANDVNVGRWLTSEEKGLLAGSVAGEWVIKPSSAGEALSPTNISAKQVTFFGSANLAPLQVGKSTIFTTRTGRKLREMTYFFDVDGFRCPDLSQLSEHISGASGFKQIAYQKEPQSIVWCVRTDGVLVGMTYERDLDSLKVGWHRHIIGGVSDAASTAAVVESVAVIPSPDGTREELWMIVKRRINGATKRYVEYLTKLFEDTDEQEDAFFVDCGLTYDAPKTITGITAANPVVVTAASHGFSNGDSVLISEVLGMDEVIDVIYQVANVATNTFELQRNGANVNGTAYTAYVSGGEVRKMVTTVSGLHHLEGQTVSVLGDGAAQIDRVVTSGAITVSRAAVLQIGLPSTARGQLLRIEAGSADGTALGKTRRTNRVGILFHRSLGLSIGMDFDHLKPIQFRQGNDPMSQAIPLYSGIVSEVVPAGYDFENQFCWEQSQPLPSTILAIMPQMKTEDRG